MPPPSTALAGCCLSATSRRLSGFLQPIKHNLIQKCWVYTTLWLWNVEYWTSWVFCWDTRQKSISHARDYIILISLLWLTQHKPVPHHFQLQNTCILASKLRCMDWMIREAIEVGLHLSNVNSENGFPWPLTLKLSWTSLRTEKWLDFTLIQPSFLEF
jgi:hypothetical protein